MIFLIADGMETFKSGLNERNIDMYVQIGGVIYLRTENYF